MATPFAYPTCYRKNLKIKKISLLDQKPLEKLQSLPIRVLETSRINLIKVSSFPPFSPGDNRQDSQQS
jgi:hypothetical protein